MQKDTSQKNAFLRESPFQVIIEIDFLCLNRRPIKARIHVPLLEIQY